MYAEIDTIDSIDYATVAERVRLLERRIDILEQRFERERELLLDEDLKARGLK